MTTLRTHRYPRLTLAALGVASLSVVSVPALGDQFTVADEPASVERSLDPTLSPSPENLARQPIRVVEPNSTLDIASVTGCFTPDKTSPCPLARTVSYTRVSGSPRGTVSQWEVNDTPRINPLWGPTVFHRVEVASPMGAQTVSTAPFTVADYAALTVSEGGIVVEANTPARVSFATSLGGCGAQQVPRGETWVTIPPECGTPETLYATVVAL